MLNADMYLLEGALYLRSRITTGVAMANKLFYQSGKKKKAV